MVPGAADMVPGAADMVPLPDQPVTAKTGLRAPLAAAVRMDRAGLRPWAAARATAGVVVPLIAGVAAGQPTIGATAGFGALSVGIPSITASPRTPTAIMLATSAGMGLATFVGSVTGLVPALHLVVLTVAGFVAGLLVAAGPGAAQVGVNAAIALIVFGRFAAYPGPAAVHAGWVLAGGLFQTALAAGVRSPRPLQPQRAALAAAYEALATATMAQPPIQVAEAAAAAGSAVHRWLEAGDRPESVPLQGLVDELDRIRQEIHALNFERAALGAEGDGGRLADQAGDLVARALGQAADALRQGDEPTGIDAVAVQLLEVADNLQHPAAGEQARPGSAARFSGARVAALAGQLRAVSGMVTALSGARRVALPVAAALAADAVVVLPGALLSILRQIRAATSPSSPAFRHAMRLAVVVPLAAGISELVPWQRGYWLPMTALIVLKPDFAATISRGAARLVGTGIGVIAAAAVVAALHPHGAALIALIAACTWIGYTVFIANYAIYAVFLTFLVVLLLSSAERSALSTVTDRGFDTLIGGGIAIAAYLLWPTWEAKTLRAATADRYEALRRYLSAVLRAYLEPQSRDTGALARLAGDARRAQSSVVASLERARAEPARGRPDVERYAGVLASGRRIVGGTHALASHLQDSQRQVAVPAAAVLVGQLDEAMAALVQAIRAGSPPGPLAELRQSQRDLAAAAAAGQTSSDRRGAVLAALLDSVVDSINTAASLLGEIGASH
jgi:uncharacterized membrane protein YccC